MATKIKLGTDGNWAVKENALLAYNDENNVFKAIELQSSRASGATYVGEDGLIADAKVGVPRIDWTNGVGELLLEPQRTNLVTNSAEGNINLGGAPTLISNTISPDGTNTASIPTASLTSNRFEETIVGGTYPTNTKVTYSWYRKRISTPIGVYVGDLSVNILVNCTQIGATTQIESDFSGYDRFQAVFNVTNGSLDTIIRLYYGSVVGVGNSSVAYWGHQLEVGDYATSYIPTSGSTATRIADAVTGNSSLGQVINSSEGVLYAELKGLGNSGTNRMINLGNGSSEFGVVLRYGTPNNTIQYTFFDQTGALSCFFSHTLPNVKDSIKVACVYKVNEFKFYVNGLKIGEDLMGNTFSANSLNRLRFDSGTGLNPFYGKVKDVRVYNTALTDAELIALTS